MIRATAKLYYLNILCSGMRSNAPYAQLTRCNARRMAAGVGNAAVIVPFMSEKYESSVNCKLELKFGQQTGVPIVPVMMQKDYTPRGWLGLLTAGSLWTPMWDKASMEVHVEGLVRQITLALESGTTDMQEITDAPDFSVNELRDELDRLKQDQEDHAADLATSRQNRAGLALVPSPVPDLPRGVLVTQSMEQLLSYLTASDKTRVGFLVTHNHPFPIQRLRLLYRREHRAKLLLWRYCSREWVGLGRPSYLAGWCAMKVCANASNRSYGYISVYLSLYAVFSLSVTCSSKLCSSYANAGHLGADPLRFGCSELGLEAAHRNRLLR